MSGREIRERRLEIGVVVLRVSGEIKNWREAGPVSHGNPHDNLTDDSGRQEGGGDR